MTAAADRGVGDAAATSPTSRRRSSGFATEERTVATHRAASDAFAGRITAEALAQLAERTIVPELQAADARGGPRQRPT
jgi:hypothetical protein